MTQIVDGYMGKMLERMSEVIGHTYVDLDGRFNTVRTRESNLGNLLCDCVRNAAGVDVVLINGGREGVQVWAGVGDGGVGGGGGGKGRWAGGWKGRQGMEKEGDRLEGGVARVGGGGRRGCEGGRRGRRGGKGRGEGMRGGKGRRRWERGGRGKSWWKSWQGGDGVGRGAPRKGCRGGRGAATGGKRGQ